MKTIVLYAGICILSGSTAFLGFSKAKNSTVIAEQANTIKEQREMIERLAQQEAIAIHITNEFKSNAVFGKVVVDANIKNTAEQCASILKAELNTPKTPLKQDFNGH